MIFRIGRWLLVLGVGVSLSVWALAPTRTITLSCRGLMMASWPDGFDGDVRWDPFVQLDIELDTWRGTGWFDGLIVRSNNPAKLEIRKTYYFLDFKGKVTTSIDPRPVMSESLQIDRETGQLIHMIEVEGKRELPALFYPNYGHCDAAKPRF